MKASDNGNADIINPNGGASSIFNGEREKLNKIKNFKVVGNIVVDSLNLESYFKVKNLDLTGITLFENPNSPMIANYDTIINNVSFDPKFNLSNVKNISSIFRNTPNLKLTNEQVSQLLNNVSFNEYN